jgi:hypothetical protein
MTAIDQQDRQRGATPPAAIRFRSIGLGLSLAFLIGALTPYNNIYKQATPLGGGHFPLAPFFILIWLMVLVALGRHLFKGRTILTGSELLVAWIIMVLVSGMAYTGLARTFFINLTAPFHLATVENRWATVLQPMLPSSPLPTECRSRGPALQRSSGGASDGLGRAGRTRSLAVLDDTADGLGRTGPVELPGHAVHGKPAQPPGPAQRTHELSPAESATDDG